MKTWKKTKRQRKHNKYKNCVWIKLNIDKKVLTWLRDKSQSTGKPIANLIREAIIKYISDEKLRLKGEN